MLPGLSVPPSFARLLAGLRPCFTAPGFTTFCALVCGMLAATGRRTVCGMLVGAGLSGVWSHDRAHKFFSTTRWSVERLGLLLATLVVQLLVPADAAVSVVIDDTLFARTGKKVFILSAGVDHGCDLAGYVEDGVHDVAGVSVGGGVRQGLVVTEQQRVRRVWGVGCRGCLVVVRGVVRRVPGRVGGVAAGCPGRVPGCVPVRCSAVRERMRRRSVDWLGSAGRVRGG
jgi:DDE superfamily endonuclease